MGRDRKPFTDKMIKFIQQQPECRKAIGEILNAFSGGADALMSKIEGEFGKFNIIDVDVEIRPTINKTKTIFDNSVENLPSLLDTYAEYANTAIDEHFISFYSYAIITIHTDMEYKAGVDFKKLSHIKLNYIEPYLQSLAASIKTISYTRSLVTHDNIKNNGIDFDILISTTPQLIKKADMSKAGVF